MSNAVSLFTIIQEVRLDGRTIVDVVCSSGHLHVIRKDYLCKLKTCKYCVAEVYKTKEYNILDSMLERCYNENNCRYYVYGGRGITVCDRWLEKPRYRVVRNFIEDMGNCPEGLTLDRIDVNGNYEPTNCRWANSSMQAYNQTKRSTNTSGKVGVDWYKGRWQARLVKDYVNINLGRFHTFEEASAARDAGELKYFGELRGN